MKFPKEQVLYQEKAKELIRTKAYEEFIEIYGLWTDDVFEQANEFIRKGLIKAFVETKRYQEAMDFADAIIKRQLETPEIVSSVVWSAIGMQDLLQAWVILSRSKLLQEEGNPMYFEEDGANYSNILSIEQERFEEALMLILYNWLIGLMKEIDRTRPIDLGYVLIRYLDLINILAEVGYSKRMIEIIQNKATNLFGIDI